MQSPLQINDRSLELQIVNDLTETHRLRYKSDHFTAEGHIRVPRYLHDRLGNPYVLLKMTPNLQGKIRIDWLTIPNEHGHRYSMPYHFVVNNNSVPTPDSNPIMYDIDTDINGFMRLYLVLIKSTNDRLKQLQPLVPFQPVIDVLHQSTRSISSYRQMSPRELIQEFRLNNSQLAFTICTTNDGKLFVPQWHTTVFSTVLRERVLMLENLQDFRLPYNHNRSMLSLNCTNMYDDDTMQQRKRQRMDDTRLENITDSESTITDTSIVNSYLSSLPVELVHCIFDHCDVKTIFSMRRVCKQMCALVDTYNRLKLTFNSKSSSIIESCFRFVQSERIISLNIYNMDEVSGINRLYSIFNQHQLTRLRSLTFCTISDTSSNYLRDHFISLGIESSVRPDNKKWSFVSSLFGQYDLQKFSMHIEETIMEPISWPNQWKLEQISIKNCTYNAYLNILQQSPYLKIFSMRDCIINNVNEQVLSSLNNAFTAPLESLTITHCSLSLNHFDSLLSLTPSLRHLKLISHRTTLDSFFDGIYWERFISTKLQKLVKFEFIFLLPYNESNDSFNLQDMIDPFRSSFWLNDKRWFVIGAYILQENKICLHTTPIHFIDMNNLARLELSWMDNNYRLTGRSINMIFDPYSDVTPINLDLYLNRIHGQKLQHLLNALYNNTTLVKLNLAENHIGYERAQHLANVLCNNTTLKELYLGNNSIGDQGAQFLAHALQNNTTLTVLDLHANGIGRRGIQDLGNALKNNKTLITLGLGYNQIGDEEAQYLLNALTSNVTLQHLYLDKNNISEEIWNQFDKKDN